MRDNNKTEIRQSLALLSPSGKGKELISYNGYCGNTGLFEITLVNYQP